MTGTLWPQEGPDGVATWYGRRSQGGPSGVANIQQGPDRLERGVYV